MRAGRIRTLRFSPRGRRFGLALLVAYLLFLAGGLVLAPRTISNQLLQRDYRVRVVRRQQLGERLQALVERFAELGRQGRALRSRVERIERVYGLPERPEGDLERLPSGPAELPATIFGSVVTQGNRLEAALRSRPRPYRSRARGDRSVRTRAAAVGDAGAGALSPARRGRRVDECLRQPAQPLYPGHGVSLGHRSRRARRHADPRTGRRRGGLGWSRRGRSPERLVAARSDGRDRERRRFPHHLRALRGDPGAAGSARRAGDPIATVGDTGWATGPHLHYEIRRRTASGWTAVDPRDYLLDRPLEESDRPPSARGANAMEAQPLPPQFLR